MHDCHKQCNQTNENAWKCKLFGVWMYSEVPKGMRLATEKDFRAGMRLKIGMRYLVKSFHTNLYHAYRLTRSTIYEELIEFIKANHVYIKNETQ